MDNKEKARQFEEGGDQFLKKGSDEKAFESYKEALGLDPSRPELYDKIIALHEKYSKNWTDDDFAYNLSLTLKKQELLDPVYKRINARVTPEFSKVIALIKKFMATQVRDEETKHIEEIVAYGEKAIYPLIDFLLNLKHKDLESREKVKQAIETAKSRLKKS